MKKLCKIVTIVLLVLMASTMVFTACWGNDTPPADEGDGSETPTLPAETEYTLQYTDDNGVHTITVKSGALYSITNIPQRTGYTFLGLYDAEVGGTQYVNAAGSALVPFSDNKNMVLFPQYAANEYTLVLDYQGAAVMGERQMSVKYGSKIDSLPIGLTMANKEFMGWFTQPNREGEQIADQYGVIPGKELVTERNFDLSDKDGYIYLYAGFRGQMYDVTFHFDDGIEPETVQVEHGTSITDVVPETRVNGMGVYKWSTTENDTELANVFAGRVTSDIVLYAAQFAPVIDFEVNGGEEIVPLVLPAGSPLALPNATKEGYKFDGWYLAGGDKYEETVMPEASVTLFAKYMTVIAFDPRGGSEVDDIAAYAGTSVDLPVPTRDGYIFAGWYVGDDIYDVDTMPSEPVSLSAYWYKSQSKRILITKDSGAGEDDMVNTKDPSFRYSVNLKEELTEVDWSVPRTITIKSEAFIFHTSYNHNSGAYATKEHFWLYSRKMAEDQYLLDYTLINHANNGIDTAGKDMEWTTTIIVPEGMVYIALSSDKDTTNNYPYGGWRMYNYYWTIHYPDTSTLY